MSIEALKAALEADISDPPMKAVLLGLANHAGPDGRHAYPSVLRLCIYSALSERTVRRALKQLSAMPPDGPGLISTPSRAGGRGKPSEYALDLRRLGDLRDPRFAQLERVSEMPPIAAPPDPGSNGKGAHLPSKGAVLSGKGAAVAPEPYLTSSEPSRPTKNGRAVRPPAVELFRRIVQRYPNKTTWKRIDRAVGSDFTALLRWGRVLRRWVLAGHNPTNVLGMLDVLKNGWRPAGGNGRPGNARRGYDPVADMAAFKNKRGLK